MTQTITLEHGYGVYWKDGEIHSRFDLPIGEHTISDGITVDEYQTWDDVLQLDYPSYIEVSLSKTSIQNDGADTIHVEVTPKAEWNQTWDVPLYVDGVEFTYTLDTGETATEKITTTKAAGSTIEIYADGENIQQSDVKTLEVIQA